MRENLERRRRTRSDEEEDVRRRLMEFQRWICTTRCMENKTQLRWKESIIHCQKRREVGGARSPREHLGAFMRTADLSTLPATARHALEFCYGFSCGITQQRHPRQNTTMLFVESLVKKKKVVPIHHVYLFRLVQHTTKKLATQWTIFHCLGDIFKNKINQQLPVSNQGRCWNKKRKQQIRIH